MIKIRIKIKSRTRHGPRIDPALTLNLALNHLPNPNLPLNLTLLLPARLSARGKHGRTIERPCSRKASYDDCKKSAGDRVGWGIGQAVVGELVSRGHMVRGFDRRPTPRRVHGIRGRQPDRFRRRGTGHARNRHADPPGGDAGRCRLSQGAGAEQHHRRLSRFRGGPVGGSPTHDPGQQRPGRLALTRDRPACRWGPTPTDAALLVRRRQGVLGSGGPGLFRRRTA